MKTLPGKHKATDSWKLEKLTFIGHVSDLWHFNIEIFSERTVVHLVMVNDKKFFLFILERIG